MAKKKALQKNTKSIVITILVLVLSLAVLGAAPIMSAMNSLSKNIGKVNGEKIPRSYFKYYLYAQKEYYESFGGADIWGFDLGGSETTEQGAKNSALNSVVSMKIVNQKAKEMDIKLTEEELQEVETSLAEVKETYMDDEVRNRLELSDDDIKNILMEQQISNKVYEEATKDYVFNENDFEEFFREYLETDKESLTEVVADYIRFDTEEKATDAYAELASGADFIDVLKRYSLDYDDAIEYEGGIISESTGMPHEIMDVVFTTTEGEFTQVISTEDLTSHYIVKVNTITEPNEEELRPLQEEAYIQQEKQAIYDAKNTEWTDASKIDINYDLFTSITIASISGPVVEEPEVLIEGDGTELLDDGSDTPVDGTEDGLDIPIDETEAPTDVEDNQPIDSAEDVQE